MNYNTNCEYIDTCLESAMKKAAKTMNRSVTVTTFWEVSIVRTLDVTPVVTSYQSECDRQWLSENYNGTKSK
jgi:hypothetical protein